jgi:acyl-CoA synthetase (NDP forming)
MSHTAALATDDAVPDASLRQAGVVPVLPGCRPGRRQGAVRPFAACGRRVAVVTNSGGTGVELADLLDDENLDVPCRS